MRRQCNSNAPGRDEDSGWGPLLRDEEVHLLNTPLHWNELGVVQAAWPEGSQWVPEHLLVGLGLPVDLHFNRKPCKSYALRSQRNQSLRVKCQG